MVGKDSKNKFSSDGTARLYRGTTIVSMMNNEKSPIFSVTESIRNILLKEDFINSLRVLPASSMHMTIISLLRDIDRDTIVRPSYLNRNAGWDYIDKTLQCKFVKEVKPLGNVFMKIDRVNDVSIRLTPYSENDKNELTRFRDEVAKKLEIRHNGHDEYQYHITYAYRLKDYSENEIKCVEEYCKRASEIAIKSIDKFQITNPSFVIFNNMLSYHEELFNRK